MWSVWVWVIKTAVRSASPSSRSPASTRRQEMPASTSSRTSPQESTSAFPEDPLARVCTVVKSPTSFPKLKRARARGR